MAERVIVCVTNDLVIDQRVHKMCLTLQKLGYAPLLVGRRYRNSPALAPRTYATHRMHLLFRRGKLFYLEYNLRLFFFLLFRKAKRINANDLDTLLAGYWAARWKGIPLIYDAHELFTETPELVDRPRTRAVWLRLERWLFPKLKRVATVSQQIQDEYERRYGIRPELVRNLPRYQAPPEVDFDARRRQRILLYQGNLKRGRGLPLMLRAMQYLPDCRLWIIGGGLWWAEMLQLAGELNLQEPQVKFFGRLPMEELPPLTCQASIGLSVEDAEASNTHFALTNKFFDYIQARVPVLTAAELIAQRQVVQQYGIGQLLYHREPEALAEAVSVALANTDCYNLWIKNMEVAARALCWEKQEAIIARLYAQPKHSAAG